MGDQRTKTGKNYYVPTLGINFFSNFKILLDLIFFYKTMSTRSILINFQKIFLHAYFLNGNFDEKGYELLVYFHVYENIKNTEKILLTF